MAATLPFTLLGPRELIGFTPAPEAGDKPAAAEIAPQPASKNLNDSEDEDFSDEEMEEAVSGLPTVPAAVMYPLGYTANRGLTFVTSLNPCIDFFFQVVPGTPKGTLVELLSQAWKEDPLMALKLVFHLRGIRGTGKSDKSNFYEAASWLYQHHPATLVANTAKIPQFGYYKDLLELLQRIVEGEEETLKRVAIKRAHHGKRKAGESKAKIRESEARFREMYPSAAGAPRRKSSRTKRDGKTATPGYFGRKGAAARAALKDGTLKPREERIALDIENGKRLKQEAAEARKRRHLSLASRAVAKYNSEPQFAALYDSVSRVFADALCRDLEELNKNGPRKARISLAAKWCPSLDSAYDRQTLLCEGIACQYFPRSGFEVEGEKLDEHLYRHLAREKLRKEVLVPLRTALELPEVYMSAKEWHRLPYNRVASVAMKKYKEHFIKHDEKRFNTFLDKVEKGEKKIAAGALLPHEIVAEAISLKGNEARVAELQWRSMVEEMRKSGSLADSMSIVDVSGSMAGEPMEVAIALGMLTSELAGEPWKGKLITFSSDPKFFEITGSTLRERHEFVSRMPWNMSTDFQKVFDLLLAMARENRLPGERMVKRLFVYSDMEFDAARGTLPAYYYGQAQMKKSETWETDYAMICRKFEQAGFGAPPEIVFWNLRPSGMPSGKSTPVVAEQKGVALVSGFSKNLLKVFMENDGKVEDFKPINIMKEAVSGPLYQDLVVV